MNRQQPTRNSAYPLRPPRERGTWRAFALAALMHVLLALFLYHGVQWQNSTPAGAEAELWTEVPDVAAPRPVVTPPTRVAPPAPPVRDEQADIALQQQKKRQQEAAAREALLDQQRRAQQLKAQQEEEARRAQLAAQQAAATAAQREKQKQADKLKQQQLAEQQKLEQQKLQQQQQKQAQLEAQQAAKAKADAAAKAKAEAAAKAKAEATARAKADAASKAKLDRERNARLAQMQGMSGAGEGGGEGLAKSGTGTGSGGNAASPGYPDKIKRRVKPFINWAGATEGLQTVVLIRCSPSGDVLNVSVVRSSGNTGWDQAVTNAIERAAPMPPDTDGHTPPSIKITFRAAG